MLQTTLGIPYPIIQAPMAGVTSPKFVAACAEEGILGSIGAGYLDGEQTKKLYPGSKKSLQRNPLLSIYLCRKIHVLISKSFKKLGWHYNHFMMN